MAENSEIYWERWEKLLEAAAVLLLYISSIDILLMRIIF